jgi:hypothetical protein
MSGTMVFGKTHFIELGAERDGEPVRVSLSQIRKFQNLEDNRVRVWWANGDVEVLRKKALHDWGGSAS